MATETSELDRMSVWELLDIAAEAAKKREVEVRKNKVGLWGGLLYLASVPIVTYYRSDILARLDNLALTEAERKTALLGFIDGNATVEQFSFKRYKARNQGQ